MKKNILKAAFLAALTLPIFVGCELDQYPSNAIPTDKAFESVNDVEKFTNGLYSTFRGICAIGWNQYDIMTDYYQPTITEGNRQGTYYTWEFRADDTGGIWKNGYASVIDANNVILNAPKVEAKLVRPTAPSAGAPETLIKKYQDDLKRFETDSTRLSQYIGEAYFTRAFIYSIMVNAYTKNYDAAKADEQLGLPIVKTMDINARPSRASLKETYKMIEEDLKIASQRIKNTDPKNHLYSTHLVKALEARVALMKLDYAAALAASKEVIESGVFSLASNKKDLLEQFTNDEGGEFIFLPAYSLPNEPAPAQGGIFLGFDAANGAYKPDYVLAQSTINLFEPKDFRTVFFYQSNAENDGHVIKAMLFPLKYPGNPQMQKDDEQGKDANGNPTVRRNAKKPFRLAELYLTAAEAAYQLGDDATAREYLNELRTHRGLKETEAGGVDLFRNIKTEWKREFIQEGKYFFCLKRWNDGFTRTGEIQPGIGDIVVQTLPDKYIKKSVKPDYYKWVWEIPANDLTTNTNLTPNWPEAH